MGLTIRKAVPEDAYEYAACHIACWRDAYCGIIPDGYLDNMLLELEQRAERCLQTLREPGDYEFYCVEYEGSMIGRLIFSKSRDDDKPDAGEIVAIYLRADYWGKGYGRQMMDFALESLKHQGYRTAFVWVLEANARARDFYKKCGFLFDGTREEIEIGKTLIELRYTLELSTLT